MHIKCHFHIKSLDVLDINAGGLFWSDTSELVSDLTGMRIK